MQEDIYETSEIEEHPQQYATQSTKIEVPTFSYKNAASELLIKMVYELCIHGVDILSQIINVIENEKN